MSNFEINYPYSKIVVPPDSLLDVNNCLQQASLAGDGLYSAKCHKVLGKLHLDAHCLLTPSGTAALEMASLLCEIGPGDEVIMPSYTFVSSANSVVLRGGIPVFVDVRSDTLNIDETLIEAAITDNTKAIMVVHYAGVSCEMDVIIEIANRYGLYLIEDNAQGLGAFYKGMPLGTFGQVAALSFHSTKNIMSGEGGCCVITDRSMVPAAEIIREKGTNRTKFLNGEVDKYSWKNVGSSYLLSDLNSALLYSQLQYIDSITKNRLEIWDYYYEQLVPYDGKLFDLPQYPKECLHNGHIFYVILPAECDRNEIIDGLKSKGIQATSHYVPLHTSKYAKAVARSSGRLSVTERLSARILRLPAWIGLERSDIEFISNALVTACANT